MPRGCREPTGFRNSPHSKPEVGGSPSGLRASELAKFQRYCLLSPSMPRAQPLKSQPFPHPHSKQVPSDHMWPTHALGSKKCPALYILREALASCSLTQCFLSIHSDWGGEDPAPNAVLRPLTLPPLVTRLPPWGSAGPHYILGHQGWAKQARRGKERVPRERGGEQECRSIYIANPANSWAGP